MPKTSNKTAQDFVPVKEVRDGVIVLKDGSMKAVLLASSVNMALKSSDEQTAIIMQFQNFLNTIEFSVQILVQSRKLDISPYITLLEDRMREQLEELLKIQTKEYADFIKNFTESSNIMTKNFFVIVPYNPPTLSKGKESLIDKILGKKKEKAAQKVVDMEAFEENRSQLEQRVGIVQQGLTRLGVRVAQLGTEEIVEVLYKMFNPGEIGKPIKSDNL